MKIVSEFCRHYRYQEFHSFSGGRTIKGRELRRFYKSGKEKSCWTPYPRGGSTEYVLLVEYGDRLFEIVGVADCSDKDNFCYKEGARIARERVHNLFLALTVKFQEEV